MCSTELYRFIYSPIPIPRIPIPIHAHLQIVDGVCALKGRVYSSSGDEAAALLHRYDFEWLLEAVVKVHVHTHEYCSLRMFILGKDVHCCTCTMYISFTQGNHNLISHLVQSCGMLINTIGSAGVRYDCRIVW